VIGGLGLSVENQQSRLGTAEVQIHRDAIGGDTDGKLAGGAGLEVPLFEATGEADRSAQVTSAGSS